MSHSEGPPEQLPAPSPFHQIVYVVLSLLSYSVGVILAHFAFLKLQEPYRKLGRIAVACSLISFLSSFLILEYYYTLSVLPLGDLIVKLWGFNFLAVFPGLLAAVVLSILASRKPDPTCKKIGSRTLRLSILFAVSSLVMAAMIPSYLRNPDQSKLSTCESQIKNLATAIEMYSSDWKGDGPETLQHLTPEYLRTIPLCPAGKGVPYGYSITVRDKAGHAKGWEISCQSKGHSRVGIPDGYPRYNSKEGLLLGPSAQKD